MNSQGIVFYLWNLPILLVYLVLLSVCRSSTKLTSAWMEERLFLRAQCKAKCLRLFQTPEEQTLFKPSWIQTSQQWNVLHKCFRNDSELCSSECFTACDRPPSECVSSCSVQGMGCRIGCTFLMESLEPRPGLCPLGAATSSVEPITMQKSSGRSDSPICKNECRTDSACPNTLHKCCTFGCNRVCTEPTFNASTPPLPNALKPLVTTESQTILELDWSVPFRQLTTTTTSTSGPIVFILQTRICTCKVLDASQLTNWQTLIMTHQFGAKLDAFEPGKLYQFRIAAVSPNGTRGFGPASEPFPADPQTPAPPAPPRNVTDSMWRFYSSGSISVLLSWQPPARTDLPVTEYVIQWVIDHGYIQSGGQSLEGLTQFTQTLPPDRLQYIIQNLKPATSYKVQVKAVSNWHGYGRLESQPNTIFLSTQSIHPVYTPPSTVEDRFQVSTTSKIAEDRSSCECEPLDLPKRLLQMEKMFYEHGELRANFLFTPPINGMDHILEWSPQVCINSKESDVLTLKQHLVVSSRTRGITLGNLNFNCRYIVKVTPSGRIRQPADIGWSDSSVQLQPDALNLRNTQGTLDTFSHVQHSCFCTGSCLEVEVLQGPAPLNCAPADPGPPPPPVRLTAYQTGSLDYRIKWDPPERIEPKSKHILTRQHTRSALLRPFHGLGTKYRVVWAPRMEEPVGKDMYNDDVGFSPIMDSQRSDVRVVEENQTWVELYNLQPGTFYIVRVQTLVASDRGDQRESSPVALYFVTPIQNQPSQSGTANTAGSKSVPNTGSPRSSAQLYVTSVCIMAVIILRFYAQLI